MFSKRLHKQFFYVANDQLWAWQWQRGQLSPGHLFTLDRAGLAAFAVYLDGREGQPAAVVADLIEEDFQRDTLPHVGGKAGRALVARKLAQLYRETPYRCAAVQGREDEGRRDDRVLFSALTNPAALAPWLQALEDAKIPLAGLYALSGLGAAMLKPLGMADEHLLLVSRQPAGLRQSYYHDGHLKFSRLTPSVDRDGVALDIVAETEKTRQFLSSTRLLARGEVLVATVLAAAAQLPGLAAACADGPELTYRPLALEDAAFDLGLADALAGVDWSDGDAQPLFLAQLASHPRAGPYPLGDAGRFFTLWQTRLGLYAASAVTVAAAVLWLGADALGSWSAIAGRAALLEETARLDRQYRALKATLPATAERPENMRAAAQVARLADAQGPMPAPLLAVVSAALDGEPAIKINALDWQALASETALPDAPLAAGAVPNNAAPAPDPAQAMRSGAAAGAAGASAPLPAQLIGVPNAPRQSLRIGAEVSLPASDYRAIVDSVNRFAQALARAPRMRVRLAQPPLDLRPSMTLSGKAADDAASPSGGAPAAAPHSTFTLQLEWQP